MKGRTKASEWMEGADRSKWAIALSLLIGACVVSPQPIPPEDKPEIDEGEIDILAGPEGVELLDQLTFEAGPDTVKPAEGVVIVTNLDNDDAPSTVPVREDGSFAVTLAGFPGDTVRFQIDDDGNRSEPVDLAVDATEQAVSVVEDLPECLVIEPARFVALDASEDAISIVLRNTCDSVVRIAAPRLRRGRGPFTFSPTSSFQIDRNAVAFITVRANGEADEREDVLFLDVTEPVAARRAITLSVPE